MARTHIITAILASLTLLGCTKTVNDAVTPAPAKDSTIVISGYLPSYRLATLDNSNYALVSRVNYFSLIPDTGGVFQFLPADSLNLVATKSKLKTGQQLFVTLGGASAGANIAKMVKDTAKRSAYVSAVLNLCRQWNLTGVDLDWEIYSGTQPDSSLFRQLCQQLYTALHGNGYLLTAAIGVAPSTGVSSKYGLAANIRNYVDGINVMAYGVNAMDASGEQATMFQVQNYLEVFVADGVPANKLFLGVPFYLNSSSATPTSQLYSWLVGQVPNLDTAANTYGAYGYNSVKLLEDKVRYLRANGYGGIVAWDMGQDVAATSPYSLLRAIYSANQ